MPTINTMLKTQVVTEGLDKAVKQSQEFNKNMTQGAAATKKAAMAASAPAKSVAAARQESEDYGVSRSLRPGGTGASARDFAQEAQGLGGVVRLYATWAANIFAVTAAYGQLEKAAAKTRMIEAAELMSARVGTSMINLAKSMQEATGYALGLEEALQFANLGTSAGLASEQIKSLVEIAKGAANALGRDSGDSIRRIIQGTAKQEQEILDELGIFIKAKDAYEKYAREFDIKGGGDALTAQQKVVAYAAAVEKAGEKWKEFAKVEDPFSEFAAKGSEALFGILQTVNKVFVPLLSFLNETSGGITALALLIATSLTKRALPELGTAFKEAFTFDKFAKEAKYNQGVQNIVNEFSTAQKELKSLQQVEETVGAKLEADRNKFLVGTQQYADKLANTYKVIASGVFGSTGTKDTRALKTQEDVQKNILNSLTAQVGRVKDKEALMAKLVQSTLLDNKSTQDNLILGERSKAIAAEILAITKAQVAEQEKLTLAMEKMDDAELRAAQAAKKYEEVKTAAERQQATRGTIGTGIDSFKTGLASGTKISDAFALSMQNSTFGVTGFLSTLTKVPGIVAASAAGLTGLNRVAALTGGTISALGTIVSTAFSAFLGPVMIAITVWQLFGDKIKSVLGITNEYTKATDALREADKKSLDALSTYTAAISRLNEEKKKLNLTTEEYTSLLEREFNAESQQASSSEKELNDLREQIALRKALNDLGIGVESDAEGKVKLDREARAALYRKEYLDAMKTSQGVQTAENKLLLERANAAYLLFKLESDSSLSKQDMYVKELEYQEKIKQVTFDISKQRTKDVAQRQKDMQQVTSAAQGLAGFDKEFSALSDKIKKLNTLDGYLNPVISSIAQAGINITKELANVSKASDGTIFGTIQALTTYGDAANKASVKIVGLAEVMNELKLLSEKALSNSTNPQVLEQVSSSFNTLKDKIAGIIQQGNKDLLKSAYNVDPTPSKARVELIKAEEDYKLKLFEKTYKTRLDLETRSNNQALKLLDIKEAGYLITTEKAAEERLQVIRNAEKQELELIDSGSAEREAIAQERIQYLTDIYAKNIKLAGSDKEARKDATDQYLKGVADVQSALTIFYDLQNKRKEEIEDSAEIRMIKQYADLNKKIVEAAAETKKLSEEYKTFWLDVEQTANEKALDRAFEVDTAFMDPRTVAGMKAAREETKKFNKDLDEQYRTVKKLKEALNDPNKDPIFAQVDLALAEQQLEAILNKIPEIAEKARTEAIKAFDFAKKQELYNTLTETVVTALTKGGKEGAKVLRNYIEQELRRKITLQVQANISTSQVGKAGAAATDFASTVMAGYNSYNFGGGLIDGLNNLGDSMVELFPELGMQIQDLGMSISGYENALNGVGVGISALTSALDGDYGAAIGEALGYYVGGPIGAAVGKIIGSALGLTDDSGTYHTGGAGSYSSTQGEMSGAAVMDTLNFQLGEYTTEQAEKTATDISKSLVTLFDGVAEAFGLEAGYYAATAFADDTSKDGAWGALMVKLGDEILIDWKNGTDKWPGREFADGEKGQKEYLDALAKDTVTVLKDMDLPAWAENILSSLGESPTFEKLQVAMAQINALNQMFETFSTSLGWAKEEIEGLIGPLGGIQSGTQLLASYYQEFYTESERLAISTQTVKDKLSDLGLEMPASREGFRALVESARAAGDDALVANLLKLAPAFADVVDVVDETTDKIKELSESVGLTADSLSQIMVDGFMNGVDGAEIGKMIANTIQRGMYQAMISGVTNSIAEMIYTQILSPMLTSIVTSGTVAGAVSEATIDAVVSKATQMISALAQVLSSPDFQNAISSLGNLANINFGGISVPDAYQYSQPDTSNAAEDAAKEALAAVDTAFNALKKAVDAEKKLIQEQIDLAEKNLDKINALIDVLDTNIKELRGSVGATAAMQAEQGQLFITQALAEAVATGALPDADEMSEAIGAVRAGIDKGNFDSKFAEDRAKLVLAGQLDALKSLGIEQKTDAELQLEALNAQLDTLNSMLEAYQLQVDALKGVDTSVLSVAAAIAKLEAAMIGATAGSSSSGGSSNGWGGVQVGGSKHTAGDKGMLSGTTSSTPGGNGDFYEAGKTFSSNVSTSLNALNLPMYTATIDGQTYTASGGGWFNATEYLQKNPDVGSHAATLGYGNSGATTPEEFAQWHFQTYGIAEGRKYAKGGIFSNSVVTAPTVFDASLMGEKDPEAIMPLGRMPDGSLGVRGYQGNDEALVIEIRNLKNELAQMKQYSAKTAKSTEESRKLLDEVIRGGESIAVTSEIASY